MANETNAVAAAMAQSVSKPAQEATSKEKSVFKIVEKQNNFAGLNQGQISQYIGAMKSRLAESLPKHLTPERFVQIASTAIAQNKVLTNCTPSSILGSIMQASILGFPPVNALGYCYFVPYKTECQFQIG